MNVIGGGEYEMYSEEFDYLNEDVLGANGISFVFQVEVNGHWYGKYYPATLETPEEFPEFEIDDSSSDLVGIMFNANSEKPIDITDKFPSEEQAIKDGNEQWYKEYERFISVLGEAAEEAECENVSENPPEEEPDYYDYDDRSDYDGYYESFERKFVNRSTTRKITMKKLNITKEQFNKSKYFRTKYGSLKYVSESGKLFKTDKGRILKFNEAKKSSDFDGIGNSWDRIKEVVESTSASIEEAAERMKVFESITLDLLESRINAKHATSTAKKAEGETKFIDTELKGIAEQIGGDAPLFFAVAERGRKVGVLINKVTKVTSQKDVRDATLATLTNPEINAQSADLNQMANSIISMIDLYERKLLESGIINPEGHEEKVWKAQGIYSQDDDGKMKKLAEGRISDMAKGAWSAIKGGASKIWTWISDTFCPKLVVKEERLSDMVQKFDDYLGKVEAQVG